MQLVFEVPIEDSNLAYNVLGGMPNPASEVWCAIARLTTEATAQQPPPDKPNTQEGERKKEGAV